MKKKYWSMLGVAALALVMTACAPKESSVKSPQSTPAKATTIRIGTMAAPDSLPLYVAQQEGYFKKHNLKVDLTAFKSPKDRDAAISGGQLDAAVTDALALTTYVNGKNGFKSATALTGYFGVVTSDDSVQKVADLKGKTIATMPRQTPTFYLTQQLEAAGLKEADVNIQQVADIPVRLQLVASKKAAATILPDPFLSIAKSKGLRVIAQSDPQNYQTTLLAVDKSLAKNKTAMKNFDAAYNEAVATINKHKASDYQDILVKQLSFPQPVAEHFTLPKYQPAKAISDDTLKATFDYAKQSGVLTRDVTPSDYQLKVQ